MDKEHLGDILLYVAVFSFVIGISIFISYFILHLFEEGEIVVGLFISFIFIETILIITGLTLGGRRTEDED